MQCVSQGPPVFAPIGASPRLKPGKENKTLKTNKRTSEDCLGVVETKPGNYKFKTKMTHFVYILNSIAFPQKFYVGYTLDVQARLQAHNGGKSIHTKNDKPWRLHLYCGFNDKEMALSFEKYLKSHSGRAFAKKHFSKKIVD